MASYTEDEAKTKWCPESRIIICNATGPGLSDLPSGNRLRFLGQPFSDECPNGSHCVASACMWWKWDPTSEARQVQPRTQAEKIAATREAPTFTAGYCGAVGP